MESIQKKKLGFIVNPVAGIGGKVGLKGSDGLNTVIKALELGAVPESGNKALLALLQLKSYSHLMDIYTYPGEMGASVCESAGLSSVVLGTPSEKITTPSDTIRAARNLRDAGVDLILFAGGDGTARNILDAVGTSVPVLGIPTGCKIHSGVYALNPKTAGELAAHYIRGNVTESSEAEVMDIDEDLFRQGIVQARLYGYLRVLKEPGMVQNLKSGKSLSESASLERLSAYISDNWQDDILYIVGTGSTTASVMKKLCIPNTLLGVDLVYGHTLIASDCAEKQILETITRYNKIRILVTVIGGQGYVFGRGNQQISAAVIRAVGKENIIVIASKSKMLSLFNKPLYIDTGDENVNKYLTGYQRVIVGYGDAVMARITD